ncbi:chemotaxis protein CheA [Paenibacillus koleovorans]|uniref:chemotaxis protein CheA n=1 Tax=Paenibacillus koleovorans TaxID=121608 RepID=UPI0013E2B8AE|nr:chemotaxis protein CheA [Paenibacillus koleovorans]
MSGQSMQDSYMEMYVFEMGQLTEQLEQLVMAGEKSKRFTAAAVHEIFRIMHTIKGSSAMMGFSAIAGLAHSMEDIFGYLRAEQPGRLDASKLSDLVLDCVDYMKAELDKLRDGQKADGDTTLALQRLRKFLAALKNEVDLTADPPGTGHQHQPEQQKQQPMQIQKNKQYKAVVFFEEDCQMENIRAYNVVHRLQSLTQDFTYTPDDILENENAAMEIQEQGFQVELQTDKSYEEVQTHFMETLFLSRLVLTELPEQPLQPQQSQPSPVAAMQTTAIAVLHDTSTDPIDSLEASNTRQTSPTPDASTPTSSTPTPSTPTPSTPEPMALQQTTQPTATASPSIISVNVGKLDKLMDLVGEMVIAEAMVTQNNELDGLELEQFHKAARHLRKITKEVQDIVMSVRMVPLTATFHKMQRIVRDMGKKLDKDIRLEMFGEATEVDKTIMERISDPIMHLVRNSIDHGIEPPAERLAAGKPAAGTVTLEANHAGSDVLIIVRDDGRGLNKAKLLRKAEENRILRKPAEEMTEREIHHLIFHPGFSTKDNVSEFSGRGVGMDVVTKNIEMIGGSVAVDSREGEGTAVTIRIPLTLAIIDGMIIRVGEAWYTIPTAVIKQSFRPSEKDRIHDPDGNEMVMVRGQCCPILRLDAYFQGKKAAKTLDEGIVVMVEDKEQLLCLFADELLGERQVVVKALPDYIKRRRKIRGLAGCTLIGDGPISLILDVAGLIQAIGAAADER